MFVDDSKVANKNIKTEFFSVDNFVSRRIQSMYLIQIL